MRGVEITPKFTWRRRLERQHAASLFARGTHMDAQVHFEAGPETIDQHAPQRCMGRAWLVNLAGIAPKALIEISSLGRRGKRIPAPATVSCCARTGAST